ncbi:hypothetical protein [Clostridium uliginosum]|uniref:Uncharacterized protein n=1 Tax=Clostridium uliginosum TaxID=119641 RepID=A0A1I1IZL4_9CLOT|nr:hypothetical protein [Clostridium uliginosum]SFC41704.1 hypothetical protein SAMN05421842_103132 [Clostridium uliginosum]
MYEDLDKLIKNMKNNPIRYISLIILLGIVVPLFIQTPYWIGNYYLLITTDFKASDILSFWGNFLAFIATTTLGVLALWQNKIIQDKANDENKKLQEQNDKLREQDIERYKLEIISKYYSNVMFCDDIQIRTKVIQQMTEETREKYNEQVLYKKDDFNGSVFDTIEVKFILKLLNQHVPQSIKINGITLRYNGCSRKDEDNVINGGESIRLLPRKEYFSPLSINKYKKFKLSATLCINNITNENNARNYTEIQSKDIAIKIEKSTQIFIVIDLSIKNPFNINTTALYIISLKNTNEIDNNNFLKFKIEDITMQLVGLNMEIRG